MSTPAPSQFAALLRQSRFASYDPSIGQVYTSFGGHAQRGNWGLKRPLPLRRRKGNVTVQAIDSTAQQTEWKGGERQTRWIQMWEEVGLTPRLADGPWRERLGPTAEIRWDVDSEFGLATKPPVQTKPSMVSRPSVHQQKKYKEDEEEEELSEAIPNVYAMTDRAFERYLKKLREMRPAFLNWLDEQARAAKEQGYSIPRVERGSLWRHRQAAETDKYKLFLMSRAFKEYSSHDSRVIEQQPQLYGGLVYARTSMLQSKILAEPQPGRILERLLGQGGHAGGDYVASFAGMTPHLHKALAENKDPINWRSLGAAPDAPDAMRGATTFRVAQTQLFAAPATVRLNPAGLDGVGMSMDVYVPPDTEHGKQNPYPPGSREYVGYQRVEEPSMIRYTKPKPVQESKKKYGPPGEQGAADIVQTLTGIISNTGPPSNRFQ
ncbi:mitochondrial ribosomal protein subunit-domain-containing protein [Rhodofomes roseus]|uniref:Mitochondrial ribosomal protein subunit-domain-containing protein n=1 Tax=Rhodofomes roseus TaxID=34475 RepID=A0ABQ8KVN5_9APHY|nr:mitochondrial ribosomal protein subunit-domain-containing protein [Rhodofomes roseus]KAH9843137.1 mitochondrial ribosomal protein subunit-domain-containing protein [Rhodofomes roseus]